jgi:hypothetical protein
MTLRRGIDEVAQAPAVHTWEVWFEEPDASGAFLRDPDSGVTLSLAELDANPPRAGVGRIIISFVDASP